MGLEGHEARGLQWQNHPRSLFTIGSDVARAIGKLWIERMLLFIKAPCAVTRRRYGYGVNADDRSRTAKHRHRGFRESKWRIDAASPSFVNF